MDSISALNVFVQVAQTRSLVGAGRLLGVSASAIGKRIAGLEEELGVRLFHRSTRSVTLTAEGLLFLQRCQRILGEVEAAQEELSQVNQAPRGRLRVSLPLVAEPFLPVLAEFKRSYPEVDLELDFSDRRVEVIEEGFDAVIRSGEAQDSRLTTRRIGAYRMLIVGAPGYFAQRGTPRVAADLARHACIRFRFPNSGKMQAWPLGGAGGGPEVELPMSMVSNNLEARVCFAREGLGIAYLPDFAIDASLAAGSLVQVLPDCTESGIFQMMWPSGKNPPPKLRALIDFLSVHLFPAPLGATVARGRPRKAARRA